MTTLTVPSRQLNLCCINLRSPVRYASLLRPYHPTSVVTTPRARNNVNVYILTRLVHFGMKVEDKVLEGPKSDLRGFLTACDQLHKNIEYLTLNRSLKASDTALNHATEVYGKGMSRLEEEFRVLLKNNRSVLRIETYIPFFSFREQLFFCCCSDLFRHLQLKGYVVVLWSL